MLSPDDATLAARRRRVASALAPILGDAVLIIRAGEPVPLPENTDQTYPFFAHTEYVYLAGIECARGVLAFDPRAPAGNEWVSFVPALTEGERVWEGREQEPGAPLSGLPNWLAARAARTVVVLGATQPAPGADLTLPTSVREVFKHARRSKDEVERSALRRAAACTAKGYAIIRAHLTPGVTERALQIELEAAFQRAGASGTGYGSIVGSGPNAAVLHFEPGSRAFREGDFVLVDAGARVGRYVCDVTRTFVVGHRPTPFQRDLHRLVVEVEERAIGRCRPGTEWKDVHLQAAVQITAGLVDLGLMIGNAESLVEREAHTLFFPHGLGHLVGLGVRDASGTLPGRPKDPRPCLQTLRTDLPLAEGYVITVEPGIYFIPALLQDPGRRQRFHDCVDWVHADSLIGIGGVRIEDNVLVTAGDPEVLTAMIPKAP